MIYGPPQGTYVNADKTQVIYVNKNGWYPQITFPQYISVAGPDGQYKQYPHCGLVEDDFERRFNRIVQ
jgi:hypothetical protein